MRGSPTAGPPAARYVRGKTGQEGGGRANFPDAAGPRWR